MPGNLPGDDNFSETITPEEVAPEQTISKDQIELAKIGNSPDWSIITKYIEARIDIYKNGLFGEDLTAQPTEVIGQRFLAAQSVIQEFRSLIDEVDRNTEAVNEVAKTLKRTK